MAGVTVSNSGWWQSGQSTAELGPGTYYYWDLVNRGVNGVNALKVDDGYQCYAWQHGNLTGKRVYFGPGHFLNINYWWFSPAYGIVVEEIKGITREDCARVHDDPLGHWGAWFSLPPGDHDGDHWRGHFHGDRTTAVVLPENVVITLYEHPNKGGSTRTLYGPGEFDLRNYWFNDTVSSITVSLDSFVSYGTTFHTDRAQKELDESVTLAEYMCDNSRSSTPTRYEETLSRDVTSSVSASWSNTTSATASVKVSLGSDNSFVKAEFGLEISNSFSVGEEQTESVSETISRTIDKEVPAYCSAKLILKAQHGRAKIPFTTHLRNQRTGATKNIIGVLIVDSYSEAIGTAEDL